jgi:aspartate oxidase
MRGVPLDDAPDAPPPDRRSFSGDTAVNERQLAEGAPASPNRRSFSGDTAVNERQLGAAGLRERLQRDMTTFAGVLRDGPGLARAAAAVAAVEAETPAARPTDGRDLAELCNLLAVGRAVVTAAAERHESRGCHHRLDFPESRQPLERIVHFGPGRRVRVPAAAAVSERER